MWVCTWEDEVWDGCLRFMGYNGLGFSCKLKGGAVKGFEYMGSRFGYGAVLGTYSERQ